MVKGSLPLFAGLHGLVGIFPTLLMSCLKPLKIVCSRDLCFLMYHLLDAFTGAYNECLGGIVARQIAALWHHFFNMYEIGGRKVQAFSMLVGDIQRAPVMARAPVL